MKTIVKICSICIIHMFSQHVFGQYAMQNKESIKTAIEEYINWYSIPGMAVGLIKDNEVVFAKGYGVKCIDESKKVDSKTIFSTASVTKLFVGTAIMQLVESNKLSLDDKIVDHLPFFKLNDSLYNQITIYHLLTHTSGLPDDTGEEFYNSWKNPEFDDGALKRYIIGLKDKALVASPGADYLYSNIGYEILGCIVSNVSGVSLEEYINQNILQALGMENSNMFLDSINKDVIACPHVLDSNLKFQKNAFFPYTRRHSASGTLLSNIDDMEKFALAILNNGELEGNRILKELSLKKMLTPDNENPAGLSWHIIKVDSATTLIYHAGGDPGFRTEFILIPEKKIGVILMANMWEHQLEPLAYELLNILLDDHPKDWFTFYHGSTWNIISNNEPNKAVELINELISNYGKQKFHPAILNQHSSLLIDLERTKYAIALRKLNLEYYPKIAALYNFMAEAYLKNNQKELAIQNYKKSLELNPDNENAKEMLEKLKN